MSCRLASDPAEQVGLLMAGSNVQDADPDPDRDKEVSGAA